FLLGSPRIPDLVIASRSVPRHRSNFEEACPSSKHLLRRRYLRRLMLGEEVLFKLVDCVLQPVAQIIVECPLLANVLEQRGLCRIQILVEAVLKSANTRHLNVIKQPLSAGKQNRHLMLGGQRLELRLLQQLSKTLSAIQLVLRYL